jgi:GTP-binding protein
MAFVDEVTVHVQAGAGGTGAVAFHREPYKPRGGPDGGNGGDGGSVILRADPSVGTLLELRNHPHVKAPRGGHGEGKRKHGARAEDRVVLVPPGTVVHDENGVLLADLAAAGDEMVGARGGRGGRGNAHFVSSTRRTPGFSEKGEPGEERRLRLELRLLADVGLVGFPNAGKSTLISRISAAKPKIADYPFTTIAPNLGVVKQGETAFVVADIPGLVPGASEGKGMGHRFLRHVSRAAVLLFLIDLTAIDRDPMTDVDVLRGELTAFDPELATRPSLVIATKADAAPEDRLKELELAHPDALVISAVTGAGLDELLRRVTESVARARAASPRARGYIRHVMRDEPISIVREDKSWRVRGDLVERVVATTDLENEEALTRLQRRLVTMGVERELAAAGAHLGDEVRIGSAVFDFEPEGEDPAPA